MNEQDRINEIEDLLARSSAGEEVRPLFDRLCEVNLDEKRECQALIG